VMSGRGLCDELITRPEESYQLWWVVMCDLETSWMRRLWLALGRSAKTNKRTMSVYLSCKKSTWREDPKIVFDSVRVMRSSSVSF